MEGASLVPVMADSMCPCGQVMVPGAWSDTPQDVTVKVVNVCHLLTK